MAIPASNIVSINPRVLTAGGTDLEMNGLLLSKNSLIPLASIVMEFTSANAVSEYFGEDSSEYIASVKYFAGYENCYAYPRRLMIARRVDEAVGAEIKGAKFSGKLGDLLEISNGALELMYNGTAYKFSGIDFSGAVTYSDVAGILEASIAEQLSGATVSYSSLTGGFTINTEYVEDTDNELEAVEYEADTDDSDPDDENPGDENPDGDNPDDGGNDPDGGDDGGDTEPDDDEPNTGVQTASIKPLAADDYTDLAIILELLEEDGAINSTGSDAMLIDENFKAIRKVTDNWVCFTTAYPAEDDEVLEYSQWASAQGVQYLYVNWTLAANMLVQGETTSIASQLADINAGSTTLVYGDLDYAAFIMSEAASIDWNRNQGVITFAFKSQDGLAATVVDETEADILLSKNCNIYGKYATRNDEYDWLYNGTMFGDYGYIDAYINAIWLNNALQVALMEGLKMSPRTPYTDAGYTMIRAWMQDPIDRAVNNGVIDEGVTLSNAQKAEIYQETGMDISEELNARGYVVIIEDAGASVRVNRESPNISLYYCYGGSIHKLTVASTALL